MTRIIIIEKVYVKTIAAGAKTSNWILSLYSKSYRYVDYYLYIQLALRKRKKDGGGDSPMGFVLLVYCCTSSIL